MKTSVVPGGGHHIACGNGMSDCVGKAEKICGDDGYVIQGGASRPKMLGGSSSAYQSKAEVAELTIVCGLEEQEKEEPTYQLPERGDEPVETAEPKAPATPVAALVCTPGTTQRCVGPGACAGGQMCSDDGRSFGACDCGTGASPSGPRVTPDSGPSIDPSTGDPGKLPAAPELPGAAPAPTPLAN